MPDLSEALDQLASHDPARSLSPLASSEREAIRERIVSEDPSMPPLRTRTYPRWRRLTKRRISIGSFGVAPVGLLAAFAVTAVAAGAVITISATTLFQADPQGSNFNGDIETVLPSTVHEIDTVSVPDYGQVEVWGATTKPGGFCFALKLPDGVWGGLDSAHPGPDGWQGGWAGGTVPGCLQTQQQQTLKYGGTATGQALEEWESLVRNKAGQTYSIFVGYVEAQGVAATVRDSANGVTAPVSSDGYYALVERTPMTARPPDLPAGFPKEMVCASCDAKDLQVLNAAGQRLRPDYTSGAMLPGYTAGPTPGAS